MFNLFRTSLPESIPGSLVPVVSALKKTKSKRMCLENAYALLSERYHGGRVKTYVFLPRAFQRDVGRIWKRTGYLHCTHINYLLRLFLVKSEHFSEADVRTRWTQIWGFSPHQYVQVRIAGKWIDVDIWAQRYGIAFGDHAHGLH